MDVRALPREGADRDRGKEDEVVQSEEEQEVEGCHPLDGESGHEGQVEGEWEDCKADRPCGEPEPSRGGGCPPLCLV